MFTELFIKLKKVIGLHTPARVQLIPWNDSHSGNFDEDEEAYTMLLDGKRTNISFAIEEGDAKHPDYEKVTMKIPRHVERYGVEIEPGVLEQMEDTPNK